MNEQTRFWYVEAHNPASDEWVSLAVAAFTKRSAKCQARKALGVAFNINEPSPVMYAHAWIVNMNWQPQK